MKSAPYTGFVSPEYIEPTICFTTDKIIISENYPLEKLPVTQIVKKDQVLVEFADTELPEKSKLLQRSVRAGTNAYLSEDNKQVLASIPGYPVLEFCPMEESEEKVLEVSMEPLFHVAENRMKASIIIKPLLYHHPTLSSEDLYQLLRQADIVSGVEYKQLNLTKEALRNGSSDTEQIVLARGREPMAGTDAYLKFKLEIGPIAGELLTDGTIDFRERKIMVPVSAGQIIAIKVPATKGKPGVTVQGEPIAQRLGLDLKVRVANDAMYSHDTREVLATSDGVLSVVQDNTIKVCSKQVITGDIDYATGNIESRDSVEIHGSVFPSFQVKTDGDLEIRGSVMSTQIASLANIVIKGGITGNTSAVTASGDIDLLFIEQGHIRCGGNCVIRKQCYYSHISSGGNIRCKEHSTLAGGELIAEGSVSLGDAGAPGADPVFIAAGVVADRLFQARKMQRRLDEHNESIIQRLKGFSGAARTKKLRRLKNGFEEMKLQHLRINMIPGTRLYSRPIEETDTDAIEPVQTPAQNDPPDRRSVDVSCLSIDVQGTIFAGTLLQIGNRTLTVEETITSRKFILDDTKSHILAMPFH